MINLPLEKRWLQDNATDLYGNVSVTKNMTFEPEGYVRVSYSPRAVMNEAIDADFDEPMVTLRSEDYGYFTETTDSAFEIDENQILGVRPTQIVTAGVPSGDLQSDAVFNSGLMIVTQDTDVDYYDPAGNTWTDTNIALSSTQGSQHPVENFISLAGFAVANVNTVLLYESPATATPTLIATLTILADFYITSLCYFNQNLYIGTMNRYGGHAFLYVWNGYGTAAQSAYEVDSNIIYDICVHQDSVVLTTGMGQLLRFNGSGFTQLDAFPIFYQNRALADETNIRILHNTLKSNGNLLYINFNDSSNKIVMTNQPQGIWCYDSDLGFMYNRYSLSNSLVLIDEPDTTDVNTTTNQITVAASPVTGTETVYGAGGGTAIGGLRDGKKYYVIKIDATHMQVADTYANAIAATPIDLTGTGNNSQKFVSFPNTDFGQYQTARTGALCVIERIIDQTQYGTDVIWGGNVSGRTNGTETGHLGSVSTAVESRGYLITPKIFSEDVTDNFNLITLKFSPFISDIDKIIIKYRTWDDMRDTIYIDSASTDWAATWTSSTTFTTTEPTMSEAKAAFDSGKSYEIEFLRGAAAGLLSHIANITEAGGTYTVTLDETFANYESGDKSSFVFRNWLKWKTITAGDSNALKYFISEQLGKDGKWLQLKIECRGVQTRIEELLIDNKTLLPAKGK